ncbi:MAG: hypothetical protein AWU57_2471 [Marinobacter sp. T13-3]|nr:MAG: hypothetical protein AWU57_2471 [Marinobacter sp. T13-3]
MSSKFLTGSQHFLLGELVEIGRRLTEPQIQKMGLLQAVIESEQEYLWRLKSVADLLRDSTGKFREDLDNELALAESFASEPKRPGSRLIGNSPGVGEKRTLPAPGTLIVREYNYQYPWPERKGPDGTATKVSSETFRFVVVDTPSKLIRLGESNGGIYLSVSGAASAATGSQTDGWRFFDIG